MEEEYTTPPRQAFGTSVLPGEEFMGWKTPGGIIVFDEEAARSIHAAVRRHRLGQAYFALTAMGERKFMFEYKGKWKGFEGFFASGLGDKVVYAIGEGLWAWYDVKAPGEA